ncbi:hypothetical protein BB559_001439 [Furculomyces boomerangus]|uniref:MARVEL domain-containing protein n=2 Tax=Harpellales TaxID=61421 RepID=A0A2T9Z217_9FUNG|nr:hypothetical protein BB559_001439 [Furculomyces boomerangus]PWA03573.1 hypothetical protein BB558_000253 [Smittium angustum]
MPGTIVSMTNAVFFQVISFFGIAFLSGMGYFFNAQVKEFTESVHDPSDPKAVGRACYTAAIIYAALFLFCGCQVAMNKRGSSRQISL